MSQSLTKLYAHLVFSTKNRQPFLDDAIEACVHGYLATTIRNFDSPWVVVGGVVDHVHILFDMGKKHTPVEFVEQVKRESSKFVKALGASYKGFYWQRGYGMFSVSPKDRDEAEAYVRNQEEHHRTKTFQEEYRAMLMRYGIAYDEQWKKSASLRGLRRIPAEKILAAEILEQQKRLDEHLLAAEGSSMPESILEALHTSQERLSQAMKDWTAKKKQYQLAMSKKIEASRHQIAQMKKEAKEAAHHVQEVFEEWKGLISSGHFGWG